MITFNDVLRSVEIDPAVVKLVRHQDRRSLYGRTPYDLWRAGAGEFERYQKIQRRPVFDGARFIASFVVAPYNETLFVGLYCIGGRETVPAGMTDPLSGCDVGGLHFYDLSTSTALTEYWGKMVIEWGGAYRAWFQFAAKQDKVVLEIRRRVEEPSFPGLMEFKARLSAFASIPRAWREVLSSVGGVYILVCPKTGRQYVGSAGGAIGFWGRWQDYMQTGHGGNRRMREIPDSDYQVAVLEVTPSSISSDELVAVENRWKEKILSREFGLNAN